MAAPIAVTLTEGDLDFLSEVVDFIQDILDAAGYEGDDDA